MEIDFGFSFELPLEIRFFFEIASTLNSLYIHAVCKEPDDRKPEHEFIVSLMENLAHRASVSLGMCDGNEGPDHVIEYIMTMRSASLKTRKEALEANGPEWLTTIDRHFTEMLEEIVP